MEEYATYDLSSFEAHDLIKGDVSQLSGNLLSMIQFYDQTKAEKDRIESELNFKKSVYSDFLRNLLLPSLNIWKNPYTSEVDLTILGKKYLDQNPYQDIALLAQWSSIIRDSGKGIGTNEVTNMQIGDVVEGQDGFFHIPVSIAFKSNSKRAFLLLVDKLSQTSNINNIGLVNDFSYYLFDVIREEKKEALTELAVQYKMEKKEGEDERTFQNLVIARYFFQLLAERKEDGIKMKKESREASNLLMDSSLVDRVIRKSVFCPTGESEEACYFRFRDKYRMLPSLAYSVGNPSNRNDVVNMIVDFYSEIPPLIAIDSFTFDKAKSQGLAFAEEGEYVGNITFKVYGRGISDSESAEISKLIKESCFGP